MVLTENNEIEKERCSVGTNFMGQDKKLHKGTKRIY